MSNDALISRRTYFSQQAQNASSSVVMNINNVGTQDFRFVSTSNGTFITTIVLTIKDSSGWDGDDWGKNTTLTNGYRLYYDLTGSGKTFISDAILTNNDHALWGVNFQFAEALGGDNVLIINFDFSINPIRLEITGEVGIELGIDDYSPITTFRCLISGYTVT